MNFLWSDIQQHDLVYFVYFFVHFKHQRMILCVFYRLFHEFHANVAFLAIYAHFLPNQKYRIYHAITEMEKRADSADISVLFFLIAVLIFWLYTRKQTVLFCTVLLALYYQYCAVSTVLLARCYEHCAFNTVLLALCYQHCAISTVLSALC